MGWFRPTESIQLAEFSRNAKTSVRVYFSPCDIVHPSLRTLALNSDSLSRKEQEFFGQPLKSGVASGFLKVRKTTQ